MIKVTSHTPHISLKLRQRHSQSTRERNAPHVRGNVLQPKYLKSCTWLSPRPFLLRATLPNGGGDLDEESDEACEMLVDVWKRKGAGMAVRSDFGFIVLVVIQIRLEPGC